MKVLLIGHACSPGLGSEPGFTWNWALHLSAQHQVRVITHPQYRSRVEAWMAENPNPNLSFVWVSVDHPLDRWDPNKGESGIRFHYLLWLPRAYKAAQELCSRGEADIAHHVSWGTLGAPPPFWRLSVPCIWGPLGGGQRAPWRFLRCFGRRAPQELLRSLYGRLTRFSPRLRKAVRHSAAILVTNRETEGLLRSMGPVNVQRFLDSGLPDKWIPKSCPARSSSGSITLLWAGRLEHRKGASLALHALAAARRSSAKLKIAGDGPLRPQLEALAVSLGISERVEFLGSVPYSQMPSLFESSDLFLFTSLRDSFGSVVLEAMAHGLPVLALDHQGVGTFLPQDAAIKIPVLTPQHTIEKLTAAIEKLSAMPALRKAMQQAAWRFAKEQTWRVRAERMTRIYEHALPRRTGAAAARVTNGDVLRTSGTHLNV